MVLMSCPPAWTHLLCKANTLSLGCYLEFGLAKWKETLQTFPASKDPEKNRRGLEAEINNGRLVPLKQVATAGDVARQVTD